MRTAQLGPRCKRVLKDLTSSVWTSIRDGHYFEEKLRQLVLNQPVRSVHDTYHRKTTFRKHTSHLQQTKKYF